MKKFNFIAIPQKAPGNPKVECLFKLKTIKEFL